MTIAAIHPLAQPGFVGTYRWHLPDPVMYASDLKVTLQHCATAYIYCREPQRVERVDLSGAVVDLERRPYETAGPMEALGVPVQTSRSCN